ncbi:MAG: MBL fold metallo-hydrolase [Bacteroidetes bacterium]|nr:MBL fold metallo-hydrolase [Bacteroidota bacterium]
MIQLKLFVFSPFQVNTFVLYDETGEAVVVDPGCFDPREDLELVHFLNDNKLKPVLLVNTHTHIDHILGNNFVCQKFGLKPVIHRAGLPFLKNAGQYGGIYGLKIPDMILPERFLDHGDLISFGKSSMRVLYTPGHADGSLCFHSQEQLFALTGDAIFFESIGRTDLPTGNYQTLIRSIRDHILTLDDETWLYPGHGHETTVKHEKAHNPFLNGFE